MQCVFCFWKQRFTKSNKGKSGAICAVVVLRAGAAFDVAPDRL